MNYDRYQPDKLVNKDRLIVAPYPFMGNEVNSGERYRAIANNIGSLVIGYSRKGSDTFKLDFNLRNNLRECGKSIQVPDSILETAEELSAIANDYEEIVGLGDSSGGVELKGLVLGGLTVHKALFRDATNLKAPQKPTTGELNYVKYNLGPERKKVDLIKDKSEINISFKDITKSFTEIFHYSAFWRSTWSRDAAEEIARKYIHTSVLDIGVERSFTGTRNQAIRFAEVLENIRRGSSELNVAPLKARVENGMYHSDLLNPYFATVHLNELFALENK
jgi:hypothetical protein